MKTEWDVIVLGSGLGGLSAALSFAKKGKKVLILEKSISPGGSASSFRKKGFLFESGATTLVGFEPGLPMDRLTKELGVTFPLIPLERSMVVHLNGETVERFKERDLWIKEALRVFGGGKRMVFFWKLCFFVSDRLWDLSARYRFFPFRSIQDIGNTLRVIKLIDLFIFLFSFVSVRTISQLLFLHRKENWNRFLDEQLLITNQTTSKDAPFTMAAAGLTYPNLQNYIVPGGMVELSKSILESVKECEGEILYKQEVIQITKRIFGDLEKGKLGNQEAREVAKRNEFWEVETKNKETSVFTAPILVSNLPIWNLIELTQNLPHLKQKSQRMEKGIWGAFTMGIALKVDPGDDRIRKECLHHQIHLENPLPYGGGQSVFVSLSHPEDTVRSVEGIRILSLSTHIQNPEKWTRDTNYPKKKKEIESILISTLETVFPWFHQENIQFSHSATPVTWQIWTGRKWGRVGGIPTSYFFNPFRMVSNRSEESSFLLTGDTVYPGQGIPAVVLGGLNAVDQFLRRKRG